MGLPNFSVKRPVTILMIFAGIVLIGLVCLSRLPVELMPNVSFGEITIFVDVRGGIPPSEIETRVSKPIEEAVGAVTHIKNILSISKEGNSTVILEFEPGTNMDFAALEVREKLARIKDKLPREIEKPVVAKYEYLDVPIMILAVTSEKFTPEEMRRIVDDSIKDRIARIEGVAKVEVSGGRERKILVEVDQARLAAYFLSIERVIDILNLSNLNLLAGDIERKRDKYLVRAMGEFETLEDIEEIGLALTPHGSIIRLKDVATVEDSYLEPTSFARMNVRPVVSLFVLKESAANTVRVADGIGKELERLKPILGEEIQMTPTFNQAEFVRKAVDTVKNALSLGAILAVMILLVFLRSPRSTLIVALAIPISVLAAFSMMFFLNITLNVMTLCGLALGIGMLVDNAIVVLENIFKRREQEASEEKQKTKATAIAGAQEMSLAIIASTVTTIVVFLPIIFVSREIQMLYSGLAFTVVFSLLASLFVALTLVPMLASRLSKRKPKAEMAKAMPQELQDQEGPKVEEKRHLFKQPFFPKVRNGYLKSLGLVVRFRYLFIIGAFLIFAQAIYLSTKLEREFIGVAEQNKFTVFIELPTGARLEASDETVARVEKLLAETPEVKTATARVEPWSSKVYVELVPLNKRERSAGEIIEALRPEVEKIEPLEAALQSAFIYFEEPQEVGTKEILLEIYGYDYDNLKDLAIQVASRLHGIERLTDVKIRMREGRPELRLQVDKKMAALFGLSVSRIAESVHAQMRGLIATRYHTPVAPFVRLKEERAITSRPPGLSPEEEKVIQKKMRDFWTIHREDRMKEEAKEIETITRLQEQYRRTRDDLHRLILTTPTGEQIRLGQISRFDSGIGPSEIWRKNKSRMVQVSANTGGMALGTVARRVREVLSDLKFPRDYFWRFGGNYYKMVENQRQLTFALWLTIILVFMVLASLFESYFQPFVIMVSVPLAAIGVVLMLTFAHKPVGIGALIGVIMLAGIVVNNAIILVDRINRLRKEKGISRTLNETVIQACSDRLRPILMTTSTTVLGLLPMALDKSEAANLWSPLALTVIGGLVSSTFLTLFILPSIYLFFNDLRNMLRGRRK